MFLAAFTFIISTHLLTLYHISQDKTKTFRLEPISQLCPACVPAPTTPTSAVPSATCSEHLAPLPGFLHPGPGLRLSLQASSLSLTSQVHPQKLSSAGGGQTDSGLARPSFAGPNFYLVCVLGHSHHFG